MIDLAKALEEAGLKNYIGVPENSYMFLRARQLGLATRPFRLKSSLDPAGIRNLRRIIKEDNIDILHSHEGKTFWPCVFVKWFEKPTFRVVFHRRLQKPHRFYSRSHYRFADAVITVSQVVKDQLIHREHVSPEKIHVIYDFVDFSVFNEKVSGEEIRKKHSLGNGPVVGMVGTMDPEKSKGENYLIEAAKLLDKDFPDTRYLIIGKGVSRNELECMAREYGLSDKIIFAGYQETIQEYIAATDIFCLLSWKSEGLGNVLQEAQAMGKPVIGTGTGGIPETFQNQETGILVASRNVEDLAHALRLLIEKEPLRFKMARNAIQFTRTRFSEERAVSELVSVYDSLLAGQAGETHSRSMTMSHP
jgi:glycosyltransferase involved in cell wall biosynthesis